MGLMGFLSPWWGLAQKASAMSSSFSAGSLSGLASSPEPSTLASSSLIFAALASSRACCAARRSWLALIFSSAALASSGVVGMGTSRVVVGVSALILAYSGLWRYTVYRD